MTKATAPLSVITAYYRDPVEATAALGTLKKLRDGRAIEILDAAVMRRNNGGVEVVETAEISAGKMGAAGAVAGGILGVIFPPSILALGAIGAAAGAAAAHFTDQGFDNNLLKEIGENLPPGGAALVAVIEEKWIADLAEIFAGYADLTRFAVSADTSKVWLREVGRMGGS